MKLSKDPTGLRAWPSVIGVDSDKLLKGVISFIYLSLLAACQERQVQPVYEPFITINRTNECPENEIVVTEFCYPSTEEVLFTIESCGAASAKNFEDNRVCQASPLMTNEELISVPCGQGNNYFEGYNCESFKCYHFGDGLLMRIDPSTREEVSCDSFLCETGISVIQELSDGREFTSFTCKN